MKNKNTLALPLKPLRTAKVSEISEATAAATIPFQEKINFHIGNPLQDKRLVDTYFSIATGHSVNILNNSTDIDQEDLERLKFLHQTIQVAVPYLPVGGFNVKKPPALLKKLQQWLTEQDEALYYSFGEKSPRECIITSGGIYEFLRVFFTTLSRFSQRAPLLVTALDFEIPQYLKSFQNITFVNHIDQKTKNPTVVLISSGIDENKRRHLRKIAEKQALLFCEFNDTENISSLAREAGLKNNVIRLLSPTIFNKQLKNNSLQFVLGNAELLKRLAAVHFELKGTPSSTELSFLDFYLKKSTIKNDNKVIFSEEVSQNPIVNRLSNRLNQYDDTFNRVSKQIDNLGEKFIQKSRKHYSRFKDMGLLINSDLINNEPATNLLKNFLTDYSPDQIEQTFLNHFCKNHPQYTQENCFVVSGSSRTALSILGQHCNIKNILTFDWSWSYENGFDNVSYVPLLRNASLNSSQLLEELSDNLKNNPGWNKSGAVIINNPHNASGRVFDDETILKLLIELLNHDIYVIDDLCYQNVAPSLKPIKFQTLKELAIDAIKKGLLSSNKINRLITVHSLSKTDCFAGARLTIAEIADANLAKPFSEVKNHIVPNTMALFLSYLFYRNEPVKLKHYWNLRNSIFYERSSSLSLAINELPNERNPFKIYIQEPEGSMYPHLVINDFPAGISIDNISRKLANRGYGLVPLTAFSKTEDGFDKARKSFRLTLGGVDNAETLKHKTRRLALEINRLLHEESQAYQEFCLPDSKMNQVAEYLLPAFMKWKNIYTSILNNSVSFLDKTRSEINSDETYNNFIDNYLPWRLSIINKRINDIFRLYSKIIRDVQKLPSTQLSARLHEEFFKENIESRQNRFKSRLFDRTVHPTQMFSLEADLIADEILKELIYQNDTNSENIKHLSNALFKEYQGINVPINSEQEADELIYDLKSYIQTELYTEKIDTPLLSFWGDWDGSTRPSGQGHRLVAAVLLENVKQLAHFLLTLKELDPTIKIENELNTGLQNLAKGIKQFWKLLNKITQLTNQLENRYKGLLPGDLHSNRLRRTAIKLKLSRDPISVLLTHNNRLEKRMLKLRQDRKASLEYYFELNKGLRKKLNEHIPNILELIQNPKIALLAGSYRNLLKRFVLTPRIHQNTITSNDPFTIENTVHNLSEINLIGSRYGTPGIIIALQISMSTNPEALIELSRMISRKTEDLNKTIDNSIKKFWLIPLFEDQDSLTDLNNYLNNVWEFAERSRLVKQTVSERFLEIICEIFVAGSDLSQQVGQAKSWELFKQTKALFYNWLATKDLLGHLRIKLGSGEPMQRQGGYYSAYSGKPVLWNTTKTQLKLIRSLKPSAQKNLLYAISPLKGIQQGGDIRTIQSNAAEQIFRFLDLGKRAQLFYHINKLQEIYLKDIRRVAKIFSDTRLVVKDKGRDDINRLAAINYDEIYSQFLEAHSDNFRQIIYGKDEDIIGIHVISYFVSRMVPVLRDRPTVRPSRETSQLAGQKIVERIAQTLPLSRHGSLLRAIGHNRSQSMILGVNQLTTGLFRTFKIVSKSHSEINLNSILSNLPVAEILHDLRIYQEMDLKYIKLLEPAFNTDNSALHALYEDVEYIEEYIPLLQKELIERQGLSAVDFFNETKFKTDLLPYLRPDLAILLQADFFNTNVEEFLKHINSKIDENWLKQIKILLKLPEQIKEWRAKIWELIGNNIYQQVSSFVDLAKALSTIAKKSPSTESGFNLGQTKSNRLVNQINTLLRGAADDSMRQLLYSVVEYISRLPEDNAQIPIDTMRALQDIERIIKIDEQLLSSKEQSRLRFFILQIARLAGENG